MQPGLQETGEISNNPERFTVPSGVTKVRLLGRIVYAANATGEQWAYVENNGSANFVGYPITARAASQAGATGTVVNVISPVLVVTAGDYFTLVAPHTAGGSFNATGGVQGSRYAMEIIE